MTRALLIIFLLLNYAAFGQVGEVKVLSLDLVRRGSSFERINQCEHHLDSLSELSIDRRIQQLTSSSRYKDSLSIQSQIDTVQKMNEYAIRYKENRSRFILHEYQNDKFKDSMIVDCQSKAICLYEDSSLSILTGFGIFGGMYFELNVKSGAFTGTFSVDEYKEKVFKHTIDDSMLRSSIEIPLKSQELLVDHQPLLCNGEMLNGKLEFETSSFYRSSNLDPYLSKDYYNPNEVDHVYYTGELEFTCKVLEPVNRIEW